MTLSRSIMFPFHRFFTLVWKCIPRLITEKNISISGTLYSSTKRSFRAYLQTSIEIVKGLGPPKKAFKKDDRGGFFWNHVLKFGWAGLSCCRKLMIGMLCKSGQYSFGVSPWRRFPREVLANSHNAIDCLEFKKTLIMHFEKFGKTSPHTKLN